MENFRDILKNYQAEVYLALGTVIQAITLTALGNELVVHLKNPQFTTLIWVFITALLSFLICVSFWFVLIRDFFFGARVFRMNAVNHFVLATTIFAVGFMQFIAFQFLDDPRFWLTLVVASLGIVMLHSWYLPRNIELPERADLQEAFNYDPGGKVVAGSSATGVAGGRSESSSVILSRSLGRNQIWQGLNAPTGGVTG
jgi:hypothetical protein